MELVTVALNSWTNFTLTLASLAAAAARQSTIVTNSDNRRAALVFLRWAKGTAPTANTIVELFMLKGTGQGTNERTDNAGASDAAITIVNAKLIGALAMRNNTTAEEDVFDTSPLGPLGTEWGIAVRNSTNQSGNSTEGNFVKSYATYADQIG